MIFRNTNKSPDPSQKAQSADYLRSGPNTPAALYDDAAGKFAEIWGSSRVGEARMFLLAILTCGLALASVATVLTVLPLKEVRPWLVEINPTSGLVSRPVEVQRIDPNVAVVKAELARWAEAVYAIDPLRSSESLRWANQRTADKAVGQFAEFRSRERIFERINREPDMVREVKVTAVDVSQRGTAFIFLTTSERVGSGTPAPDKARKFRITLNYKMVTANQEKDLLVNPLGLYVTFFSDTEERAL
jgi:type IV secretory pathway component VirB8